MYSSEVSENIIYIGDGRHNGFLDCILAGTTRTSLPDQVSCLTAKDGCIFGYITSGNGVIRTEDGLFPVSRGYFYFIAKGNEAEITPALPSDDLPSPWEEPLEQMWFRIDGSMAEDLIRTFRLGNTLFAKADLRRHFVEIHDKLSYMREENASRTLQQLACLLFEMLAELRCEEFFAPMGHGAGTAETIRNYLDNNIYNDLSLDVLTEQFGFSKMHIIRLFRKEYGTTPMQYLMERKLSLAKSLLSGTVMPIREISELLRYSNTQHFSNSFRKAVGLSPNSYRKAAQNKK